VIRLHILESSVPTTVAPGLEFQVDESPAGWAWRTQKPLVINNIEKDRRFPSVLRILRDHKVRSVCSLPLTTAQRRIGALGLGSSREGAYAKADLKFLAQVANQVAVAVDNALNVRSLESYQWQLAQERDRLRALLDITNAVMSNLDLNELRIAVGHCLHRIVESDAMAIGVLNENRQTLEVHPLLAPAGSGPPPRPASVSIDEGMMWESIRDRQPVIFDPKSPETRGEKLFGKATGALASACLLPLIGRHRVLGVLILARARGSFRKLDVDFLTQAAGQIAIAIENALQYQEIAKLKEKLAEEKLYLEDEIRTGHNFEEIVGESLALKRVLKDAETVAPTFSTVLILGETGTGKELIARAIHYLSGRGESTFVKLNCAAIPTGLLESELFGHERGAFTGAITQKIGRFELANGGTLFLDEVGDIPLELQPKLLRVIQEQEFERLGGTRTIRADVRMVAATNRDLAQMVRDGQFRSDLFYRLSVFPMTVPPLRDRTDDIPLLVRYFAQRFARQMNRKIDTIPSETMKKLTHYPWPGNIRELENLVERAVILSSGMTLQVPLAELRQPAPLPNEHRSTTLVDIERQHILRTLADTNWVISGRDGAAARLGMKRSTLQSRMNKLGISRA
jgi:formate hydrogenlyase transcriptional activator